MWKSSGQDIQRAAGSALPIWAMIRVPFFPEPRERSFMSMISARSTLTLTTADVWDLFPVRTRSKS